MALFERRLPGSTLRGARRRAVAAGLVAALLSGAAHAGPPPPPAYEAPRPPANDPLLAPGPAPGVLVAPPDPPPLPIAARVLYAPFYVTGLVLRYGIHYLLVAPFEVLGRTLTYGAEGGVDRDPASP